MRFRAVLELNGRTATGVEVPGEVVAALGPSRRPAVKVTINGHSYGGTVAAMGGRFMLPVSAENRTAAGVAAGDQVEVELVLDGAPRVVTVPDDLRAALDAAPVAARRFAAQSYSHQRAHVLSVEGAKAAETRARRVARVVDTLLAG